MLAPIARRLRAHPRLGGLALRSMLRLIPDWTRQITIEPIGPFVIRNRRHRGFWLHDPLLHERFAFGFLRGAIGEGGIVWEVGANIGLYARFEAQVFGAGHIVAFEPMSENRSLLERNIALGGVQDRVTIMPIALGDQDGPALLQIDDVQSGTAALDGVTGGKPSAARAAVGLPAKTEEVMVRTMDSLLAEGKLPEPTVMKIDVEGAEALVLEGAREFLGRTDALLLVELHGAGPARAVGRILLEHGFALRGRVAREIDPSGYAPVGESLLSGLTGFYDLHSLVACRDASRVPEKVEPYR